MTETQNRRIAVINPNSTQTVTDGISVALDPLRFADGPQIDCLTLAEGPPGIESQRHADGVVTPLCEMIAREDNSSDAFVIACFSDPGLMSAREITTKPVFGISECGILNALSLGDRFGIIAILPTSVSRHQRYIRQMALQERFAADLPLGIGVTGLQGDEVVERMGLVGERLRDDHGADVIVLGCAGMAHTRSALEDRLDMPVVDPCQAAATQALGAIQFGLSQH